jgi:hypothetical protein
MNVTRRAIERLYTDKATISGIVNGQDTDGFDINTQGMLFMDMPCKLSKGTQKSVIKGEAYSTDDAAKLLISPDLAIPAGATFVVTDKNGVVTEWVGGKPFPRLNHQEIALELNDKVR